MAKKAMQLDPHAPAPYPFTLGVAFYMTGRYEEAIAALKRSLTRGPNFPPPYRFLAAIYSELGQMEEAQAVVRDVLRLRPRASLEVWRQRYPYKDQAALERFIEGLRGAGLPE